MARKTRQDNVLDYLRDWCGGEKSYGFHVSRETIVDNIATETIAWHDLKDNAATQSVYRGIVRGMLTDEKLHIFGEGTHTCQWLAIK